MGCGCTHTLNDEKLFQTQKLSLNLSKFNQSTIMHSKAIVSSISKLRNRMLSLYHKLIYKSGACVFVNPTMTHCFHCVMYKIAAEFKGLLENAKLCYIEDPPYLQIGTQEGLDKEAKEALNFLFDFIIELRSYKALIKQIDKDIPELLYLVFENKNNISEENEKVINTAIEVFKHISKFRTNILKQYKEEVYMFVTKSENYCKEINKIAKEAYNLKLKDIYQIAMLFKKYGEPEKIQEKQNLMYSNEDIGKKIILDIIDKDKMEEEIDEKSMEEEKKNII